MRQEPFVTVVSSGICSSPLAVTACPCVLAAAALRSFLSALASKVSTVFWLLCMVLAISRYLCPSTRISTTSCSRLLSIGKSATTSGSSPPPEAGCGSSTHSSVSGAERSSSRLAWSRYRVAAR